MICTYIVIKLHKGIVYWYVHILSQNLKYKETWLTFSRRTVKQSHHEADKKFIKACLMICTHIVIKLHKGIVHWYVHMLSQNLKYKETWLTFSRWTVNKQSHHEATVATSWTLSLLVPQTKSESTVCRTSKHRSLLHVYVI